MNRGKFSKYTEDMTRQELFIFLTGLLRQVPTNEILFSEWDDSTNSFKLELKVGQKES